MEDSIINFETAKLAKEKGFDENVKGAYNKKGEFFNHLGKGKNSDILLSQQKIISAPTQSLLQKWLRDLYNIIVEVTSYVESSYSVAIENKAISNSRYKILQNPNKSKEQDLYAFSSWEEALEEGLKQALLLI